MHQHSPPRVARAISMIAMAFILITAAQSVAQADSVVVVESADANNAQTVIVHDDSSILLLGILLLGAVAIMLGMLAAAGAVVLAFVMLGVISSSVLLGVVRRRGGAAVRALIVQVAALFGAIAGYAAAWLGHILLDIPAELSRYTLIISAICGVVAGIIIGCSINYVWGRAARWLSQRWAERTAVAGNLS